MVSIRKNKNGRFSKCRACGSTSEINEFGFCRKCVQERAKRLIETHQPESDIISNIPTAIGLPESEETTEESRKDVSKTTSSAPFQSKRSGPIQDDTAMVADHDIVADWEKERKERITERDRLETKRIEDVRDREISAFKSNIAGIRVLRDIGNALEIEVKYHSPVSNKSRIAEKDPEEINDFFKILTILSAKAKEQISPANVYEKELTENVFKVKMDLKPGDTFVRMISGGNYDFRDGTTRGYWLVISLENNDEILLRILVKACKKLGFIFLSSPNSATGLLQRGNISYVDMGRLLDKVKEKIIEELPPQTVFMNESDAPPSQACLPKAVSRKIVDSILSRLANIMLKEVNHMIRKGQAFDESEAKAKISYDNYVSDIAKSYSLPDDTVRQIISYWISLQRE